MPSLEARAAAAAPCDVTRSPVSSTTLQGCWTSIDESTPPVAEVVPAWMKTSATRAKCRVEGGPKGGRRMQPAFGDGPGCQNSRMPTAAQLGRWGLAGGMAAAAAAVGLLAGIDPRFAIAAALSLGFLLLVLGDLYVGLILFTLLTFIAQVPTVAGPGLSFAKIAGLLLAISWVATLATRQRREVGLHVGAPGAHLSRGAVLELGRGQPALGGGLRGGADGLLAAGAERGAVPDHLHGRSHAQPRRSGSWARSSPERRSTPSTGCSSLPPTRRPHRASRAR